MSPLLFKILALFVIFSVFVAFIIELGANTRRVSFTVAFMHLLTSAAVLSLMMLILYELWG